MSAPAPAQVRALLRALLREAKKFPNYNVRSYALRRIKEGFRETQHEADPGRIHAAYEDGAKQVEVVKRQALVYGMYPASMRSVMEVDVVEGMRLR